MLPKAVSIEEEIAAVCKSETDWQNYLLGTKDKFKLFFQNLMKTQSKAGITVLDIKCKNSY